MHKKTRKKDHSSPKSTTSGAMYAFVIVGLLSALGYMVARQSDTSPSAQKVEIESNPTTNSFLSSKVEPFSAECGNSGLWKHESSFKQKNLDTLEWGSLRPGTYFGMKTKTYPDFLSTGIMWAEGKTMYDRNFRHTVRQDELDHFEWIRNDGRTFGIEKLIDSKADATIEASFNIDPYPSSVSGDEGHTTRWTQHFSVQRTKAKHSLPFLFYFGLECDLSEDAEPCFTAGSDIHSLSIHPAKRDGEGSDSISTSQDAVVVGYSSLSGWFGLRVTVNEPLGTLEEDKPSSSLLQRTSYWGVGGVSGMDTAVREISQSSAVNVQRADALTNKRRRRAEEDAQPESITGAVFDIKTGALPNEVSPDAVGVVMQVLCKTSFDLTVAFRSDPAWRSAEDVLRYANDIAPVDLRALHAHNVHMNKEAFEAKFEQSFNIASTDGFSGTDIETAKRCLSNLLGGLGYFHGKPVIGDSHFYLDSRKESGGVSPTKDTLPQAVPSDVRLTLFTATPSRSSFPRGFLWDEGFHQMAISEWDTAITMDVLRHWLGCMLQYVPQGSVGADAQCPGGWIPRELILGAEATRAVPQEFITQRVDIANPPTLLLAVERLLRKAQAQPEQKATCVDVPGDSTSCSVDGTGSEADAIREFLDQSFPALHQWVQWLVHSQAGPRGWHIVNGKNVSTSGTFRWRGRREDTSRLITNTLASGLDDYPRSAAVSEDEFHVDLLSWVIKSLDVMRQLRDFLQVDGDVSKYSMYSHDAVKKHTEQMMKLHWSEEIGAFVDVGLIGSSERLGSELTVRCKAGDNRRGYVDIPVREETLKKAVANNQPDKVCPRQFPVFVSPHGDSDGNLLRKMVYETPGRMHLAHIPRIGYVSIFPLLLCVVPADSPQLPRLLDVLESPQHLWSDHGLRSISTMDMFYKQANAPGDAPYWRGPIWIPVNFLAIRSLRHYSALESCPHRERAGQLYSQLRTNVMRTILSEYERTGYFWEQYDDMTGKGMRGHPFTGWTSLLLNIMAEKV